MLRGPGECSAGKFSGGKFAIIKAELGTGSTLAGNVGHVVLVIDSTKALFTSAVFCDNLHVFAVFRMFCYIDGLTELE